MSAEADGTFYCVVAWDGPSGERFYYPYVVMSHDERSAAEKAFGAFGGDGKSDRLRSCDVYRERPVTYWPKPRIAYEAKAMHES